MLNILEKHHYHGIMLENAFSIKEHTFIRFLFLFSFLFFYFLFLDLELKISMMLQTVTSHGHMIMCYRRI